MHRVLPGLLFVLLTAELPLPAKLYTRMTGENGVLQYDLAKDEGNGWYTEPPNPYRFKVGFKQGDRASPHPVQVATLRTTTDEPYQGHAVIEMQIIARKEHGTAAYKVALSSFKPEDSFRPSVLVSKDWYHGFVMKIDPATYRLTEGDIPIFFEQFHQDSPFHPPVALAILNPGQVKAEGWGDAGPNGNFALTLINDDHGPLKTLPGQAQRYDLGPVQLGAWIKWVVRVRPSPSAPHGRVTVWRNGVPLIDLDNIKVGLDPKNPQYRAHPPHPFFDYGDVMIYRVNGDNCQRFYFDEIRFADTFEEASPP